MTPEGKIKKKINAVLADVLAAGDALYYFMPVPSGYGESSLDYVGSFYGRFFSIEAKRPGKEPTPRQGQIIASILRSRGHVFRINDDASLDVFVTWLDHIKCGGHG